MCEVSKLHVSKSSSLGIIDSSSEFVYVTNWSNRSVELVDGAIIARLSPTDSMDIDFVEECPDI